MADHAAHKSYEGYRDEGQKWLARIKAAEKREADWTQDAEAAEATYSADRKAITGGLTTFNILASNIDTIVPAIFNSSPVPDIRDRFRSGDQVAKAVSDLYENIISALIDDNKLDTEIEASAQDAFLSGRGIVRIRFDADVSEPDEFEPAELTDEGAAPVAVVTNENVSFEAISWRDYREGPARRFEDVPWVAFRHFIPIEDLEDFQNGDMVQAQRQDSDEPLGDDEDIKVWEVWIKSEKMVKFVRDSDGTILDEQDDPMGLKGFFPMPAPVQPIKLTARRTPICPFTIYKTLAEELDKTTRRINAILGGLKVKGWIVGSVEDVEKLADAGDNELVPISGFEGLAATGGIDKAIIWWPVDKAIQVLRELYLARDQTKQAIYEITGISDIVRGASKASETLGAQEIKTQWGSLRIKKMQRLIERQVRDLFVMTTELVASRFSTETIQKMTGLKIEEAMETLLRDPLQRYRIDVESDSTVRADLSRVKGELTDLLQGTASYFATMAPVIAQAPEAAEPIADIYAAFARNFNIGQQGEAALERLVEIAKQAGGQQRSNPEAEAAQATAQLGQARLQMDQAKMQMDHAKGAADQQMAQQEFQLKIGEMQSKVGLEVEKLKQAIANAQTDGEIKKIELQIKERELAIKESQQALAEAKAAFEAAATVEEIRMEKEQQRAVKLG